MLAGTLAFVAGIYCLVQFSYLPPLWLISLLPISFLFIRYFPAVRIILFYFLGFCWALFCGHLKMSHVLDSEIESADVFMTGVVTSIPETYDDHIRFLIDIKKISTLSGELFPSPGIVRLSWYKQKTIPVPGEIWRLKVRLKRPYGFMNSGGFDYEGWMFRQDIKATGYVKFDKQNQKTGDDDTYFIQQFRHKIATRLKQTVDKPLLGLLLALSLGDRSQLDTEQWRVLSQTGTNHLIAISGLHLSLIAGFIYFLARFLWSRFYFLTQRIPAPLFASVMAFAGAFLYALLAGFALPAQRALIMIAVFMVAIFSVRQVLIVNVVCIAAIIVLIIDPFAIIAVDFYLSFMAVIFILYISRFRLNKHHKLARWIRLQCLLSFALFPILIFWFKQIPLYSALANLIAIPVIGFLVVPLTLIALILMFPFPTITQYLYELINKISEYHWAYLELLSQQHNAIIPVAAPNIGTLMLAITGVLILIMPKGLPARWLGLLFLTPLLFPLSEKLEQGEFEFVLLDVGQGLSAVIQTKKHTLVYDTGAKFSKRFNVGDAVIKPYLRKKGIDQISMLIISHGDNDHIGGASAVIGNFKINKILSSVPAVLARQVSEKQPEFCHTGQKWHWDGVNFEILHPNNADLFTGNNASCVLKVSSKRGSVLLTGDIEKEAELSLVEQYKDKLHVDILLVPHHGSKTSSTESFVFAVSAEYAFVSAGYRNRFGFPKEDIMSRYDMHVVKTFISYETGEISVKFHDEGLQIDEFRTKNRRFWHY